MSRDIWGCKQKIRVVYNLQNVSGKSGWKVNHWNATFLGRSRGNFHAEKGAGGLQTSVHPR